MAARGALLSSALAIAALFAVTPAAAQVGGVDADVAAQQQTIDHIETTLASLENAARFPGDPCRRINQEAIRIQYVLAGNWFTLPPGMAEAWLARVNRLLEICPNETGLIGDPYIFEKPKASQQTNPQPATPGAATVPKWVNVEPPRDPATVDPGKFRAAEIAYINRRLAELEAMPADHCAEVKRATYHLLAEYIQPPYMKAYYPAALLDSWKERAQRLLVICEELQPPPQASSFWPYPGYASEPTQGSGAVEAGRRAVESPRLNPLNIFSGGSQQQPTENNSGNPVNKALDILGVGDRQPVSDQDAQNLRGQQAAPEAAKGQRSKARPKRDRQRDRCDRSKGQVPADCPNR